MAKPTPAIISGVLKDLSQGKDKLPEVIRPKLSMPKSPKLSAHEIREREQQQAFSEVMNHYVKYMQAVPTYTYVK